jgi:hypothetical protein
MWKAFSALAAAAALAGVVTFLPGLNNDVSATVSQLSSKGDRYDAADCDLQGWPYYGRDCLKDPSRNAGRAVAARLVSTDRLYIPASAPLPEWAAYLPATGPKSIVSFKVGR